MKKYLLVAALVAAFLLPVHANAGLRAVANPTTITGNAGTATALAANGANCSAGSYPLGVSASGAVESCTAVAANANFNGSLITLTADETGGVVGGAGDVIPWDVATYDTTFDPGDGGGVQRFWMGTTFTFATTDVNTTNNTIAKTAHGWITGESTGPFTSSGGLPAGMVAGTNYWVIRVDADTFKLATSRANALAGTAVDITTQGTGTHTCSRGAYIIIPDGVTRVQFTGGVIAESSLSGQLIITFAKNGSVSNWIGNSQLGVDTAGEENAAILSPVLAVTAGDYFGLSNFGSDAFTIDADVGQTYLSIEVVTRN